MLKSLAHSSVVLLVCLSVCAAIAFFAYNFIFSIVSLKFIGLEYVRLLTSRVCFKTEVTHRLR